MIRFIFLTLVCLGCSKSADDLRLSADSEVKQFIKTLQGITSKDDLSRCGGKVKRHIDCLVECMIAIDERRLSGEAVEGGGELLGIVLERELERVYAIQGTREVIEEMEREGLYLLDGYERRVSASKWSR